MAGTHCHCYNPYKVLVCIYGAALQQSRARVETLTFELPIVRLLLAACYRTGLE